MPNVIHGYCKVVNGKAILAFNDTAPCIVDRPEPLQRLVQAHSGNVVGYTVVETGKDQGFLWDEREPAVAEASYFTERFGKPYEALALAIET